MQKKSFYTLIQLAEGYLTQHFQKDKQLKIQSHKVGQQLWVIHIASQQSQILIKIIQIQNILKLYIFKNKNLIDSFWLSHNQHFKTKLSNVYTYDHLKNKKLLQQIFNSRIKRHLYAKQTHLLLTAFYINLQQMTLFLSTKDLINFSVISNRIYRVLNREDTFKRMYEYKWGRTGFLLSQLKWKQAYKLKVKQIKK